MFLSVYLKHTCLLETFFKANSRKVQYVRVGTSHTNWRFRKVDWEALTTQSSQGPPHRKDPASQQVCRMQGAEGHSKEFIAGFTGPCNIASLHLTDCRTLTRTPHRLFILNHCFLLHFGWLWSLKINYCECDQWGYKTGKSPAERSLKCWPY